MVSAIAGRLQSPTIQSEISQAEDEIHGTEGKEEDIRHAIRAIREIGKL
jgi:hypothetical protein